MKGKEVDGKDEKIGFGKNLRKSYGPVFIDR